MLAFWSRSDTKWQGVWAHVKFKNRTCENYMSWEFTFIAWCTIFAQSCSCTTALLPPPAAAALSRRRLAMVVSCQKRSIGGRGENLLMSGPIHVRSRSLLLRCRRSPQHRACRPHAYLGEEQCCWHLGGKCVLTPQKTQQQQPNLRTT